MSRRTTLGSLSHGTLNSRDSRASLGASRLSSTAKASDTKPSRMSMAPSVPTGASRPSVGISRRSSVGQGVGRFGFEP